MNHFRVKKLILGAGMIVCSIGAVEALELNIRPVISADELFAQPTEIRVQLFTAQQGGEFLEERIFKQGEWQTRQDSSQELLKRGKLGYNLKMEVSDDLKGEQLWAEISVDGRVVGSRLAASVATSKFTLYGDIVLNKEGGDNNNAADNTGRINFPDGTAMGSLNDAKDDMGDHTATQNIVLNGNWLSGDGADEGIHVDSLGNVGIGTVNQVTGSSQLTTYSATSSYGGMYVTTNAGGSPFYGYSDGTANWHYVTKNTNGEYDWILHLNSGDRLKVSESGDILTVNAPASGEHGINVKSPVPFLQLSDVAGKNLFKIRGLDNSSATTVQFGNEHQFSAVQWQIAQNYANFDFDGRMRQTLSFHGLVKASIYMDCGGTAGTTPTVYRDFNHNTTILSSPSVTNVGSGICEITYGTSGTTGVLENAYWTVTPVTTNDNNPDAMRVTQCRKIGNTKLRCNRFAANGSADSGRIIVTIF